MTKLAGAEGFSPSRRFFPAITATASFPIDAAFRKPFVFDTLAPLIEIIVPPSQCVNLLADSIILPDVFPRIFFILQCGMNHKESILAPPL